MATKTITTCDSCQKVISDIDHKLSLTIIGYKPPEYKTHHFCSEACLKDWLTTSRTVGFQS